MRVSVTHLKFSSASQHGGFILGSSNELKNWINLTFKTEKLFNYNFKNYTTLIQLIIQKYPQEYFILFKASV